ncbi:MAG TPA: RNA methyltransferase [Alphaproteobacteria bacterium]|nr:RNA methyltransferase [Alphaproteobacteria bacterium]
MRGYFGIGVEGISKSMNLGSLWRTAHAFGAAFVFTIGANYERAQGERADTSKSSGQVPLYEFAGLDSFRLPRGCSLVGIEILESAAELPSFPHPRQAAYVLGPERGGLSPELLARCAQVVKIPTKFSVNLALAGAIVMYDRLLCLGRFAERPLVAGQAAAPLPEPVFGPPIRRRKAAAAS